MQDGTRTVSVGQARRRQVEIVGVDRVGRRRRVGRQSGVAHEDRYDAHRDRAEEPRQVASARRRQEERHAEKLLVVRRPANHIRRLQPATQRSASTTENRNQTTGNDLRFRPNGAGREVVCLLDAPRVHCSLARVTHGRILRCDACRATGDIQSAALVTLRVSGSINNSLVI